MLFFYGPKKFCFLCSFFSVGRFAYCLQRQCVCAAVILCTLECVSETLFTYTLKPNLLSIVHVKNSFSGGGDTKLCTVCLAVSFSVVVMIPFSFVCYTYTHTRIHRGDELLVCLDILPTCMNGPHLKDIPELAGGFCW